MKKPKTPQEILALIDRQEAHETAKGRKDRGGPGLKPRKDSGNTPKHPPPQASFSGGTDAGQSSFRADVTAESYAYLLRVLRGKARAKKLSSIGTFDKVGPTIQERTDAAKTLLMYHVAKPTQEVKLDASSAATLEGLKELTADKLLEIVRTEQQPRKVANLDE